MSDLIESPQGGSLLSLLHSKGSSLSTATPFSRDIFLFDTHVAGTSHVEGILELEPSLVEGLKLNFFREPENQFDPKAIVIKTQEGEKVGYVPQADNLIFARLMDAGKRLFGKIQSKEVKGKWVKIHIEIYINE